MHILFLTHYFPPEVNAPASRTHEHAKRWVQEANVGVTVVTNNPNHPKGILYPGYQNRWFSKESFDAVAVVRVKAFLAANAEVYRRTINYLVFMFGAIFASFTVRGIDVVIATSPQFFCAVAGFVVSRLRGKPFVFELRDIWPESVVTVGALRRSIAIRICERLELLLYRQAAMIVAVTRSFRENLISRGIDPEKIVVVRNGVDLSFYQPRARPAELERKLKVEGKFVAAYIGTIGMAHAVESIVQAAALLQHDERIAFLIIGEGARKRAVEEAVATRQLCNVLVLPGVDKIAVRDYYALADLNLVTLRNQPLFRTVIPSKIFEIMAMERPILCSVDGETREILIEAASGEFVEPENPGQLAAKIAQLANEPSRLRSLASSGRRYVELHYSRDSSASEMLRHIRLLLTRRCR